MYWIFLLITLLLPRSAHELRNKPIPYSLHSPQRRLILPSELREVSGFSLVDRHRILCVQDEKGTLFLLDTRTSQITESRNFGPDGDYEGLALVKDDAYVLRSDGLIFEVRDYFSPELATSAFHSNVPALNNEGLCFDRKHNRLLIGCKSKPAKGPEWKNIRQIHAFDLKSKKPLEKPVFTFDVSELSAIATSWGLELPQRGAGSKNEKQMKLGMSEIAIHPFSGDLYLLSAVDQLLLVFSAKGAVESMFSLPPEIFNKPEGLDFAENGDLFISNEGQGGDATLLQFKYKS